MPRMSAALNETGMIRVLWSDTKTSLTGAIKEVDFDDGTVGNEDVELS